MLNVEQEHGIIGLPVHMSSLESVFQGGCPNVSGDKLTGAEDGWHNEHLRPPMKGESNHGHAVLV